MSKRSAIDDPNPRQRTECAPPAERARARAYLVTFLATAVGSVFLFYAGIAMLRVVDRLPPPPVSGTWCIDSRFAWLKNHPDWTTARLIAVGSSATWRNLDFAAIPASTRRESGGVVNLAPCFLRLNQIRYMTEFFVDREPGPKIVLTVLAPRDLEGCSRIPTSFFDRDVGRRYIRGAANDWWLYFRNMRVASFFTHVINADERRPELEYDAFGSGPLTRAVPESGRAFAPEAGCYSELSRLARALEQKDIQLIVVTFPVMPSWADRFDAAGTTRAKFVAGIERALTGTKAIFVDGMSGWTAPDAAFTDPVHLQWPETAAFTRFVWAAARQRGAGLPALSDEIDGEPLVRRAARTQASDLLEKETE
jgi:hypothetical protein